jgi:hypothetical protein
MEVQLLIGIMGTLTVVATYFWVVRAKPNQAQSSRIELE